MVQHVRYRAWLDATPGKAKVSRYASFKRRADEGEDVGELELPEVPPGVEHLVGYLFEAGPVEGEYPVTWQGLTAWADMTGTVVNTFEATTVRVLSQAYLAMRHDAKDPKCPAPVMRRESLPSRKEVSDTLGAFLRSFNTPQAKQARAKKQRARESAKAKAE